jgi:hypothetical protein
MSIPMHGRPSHIPLLLDSLLIWRNSRSGVSARDCGVPAMRPRPLWRLVVEGSAWRSGKPLRWQFRSSPRLLRPCRPQCMRSCRRQGSPHLSRAGSRTSFRPGRARTLPCRYGSQRSRGMVGYRPEKCGSRLAEPGRVGTVAVISAGLRMGEWIGRPEMGSQRRIGRGCRRRRS